MEKLDKELSKEIRTIRKHLLNQTGEFICLDLATYIKATLVGHALLEEGRTLTCKIVKGYADPEPTSYTTTHPDLIKMLPVLEVLMSKCAPNELVSGATILLPNGRAFLVLAAYDSAVAEIQRYLNAAYEHRRPSIFSIDTPNDTP